MQLARGLGGLLLVMGAWACDSGATPTAEPTPSAQPSPSSKSTTPAPSKHEDPTYAVSLEGKEPYTVGKEATLEAVLEARAPYKCNAEYPYKFKLDAAPEGVAFPKDVAKDIEKGEKRSVLRIPFSATSAGKKTIGGTFYFSVCNAEHCKIDKLPMSITVNVQPS
jgi:hypothetical protein